MPTSRLWKPFTIPQKFLNSTWKSSSPILRLPTEVLILIFNHANPLDQFSFALACKHLLQVSTFISLKTSWLVGRNVMDHRETVEAVLRSVKPLNKAGRQRKAWHICVDCLQYRPTRKSYWKKKKEKNVNWEREGEGKVEDERVKGKVWGGTWDGYVRMWNNRGLLQCPECKYHEEVVLPWKRYFEIRRNLGIN